MKEKIQAMKLNKILDTIINQGKNMVSDSIYIYNDFLFINTFTWFLKAKSVSFFEKKKESKLLLTFVEKYNFFPLFDQNRDVDFTD